MHFVDKVVHYRRPKEDKQMETSCKRWFEINYQKVVYGPIHHDTAVFYDLKDAYEYADKIKERHPQAQVWINECTLEKKEIKQ